MLDKKLAQLGVEKPSKVSTIQASNFSCEICGETNHNTSYCRGSNSKHVAALSYGNQNQASNSQGARGYYQMQIKEDGTTKVTTSDGHGPGWPGFVQVPPSSGSMWNLIRTFRFRAVPNGSLAVSTRESDHWFHFYFSFKYNIKIL